MLPSSGFLATAQTVTRSPSPWMCPTISTRFTEPLSCGPCASIFRPLLHGSTAVTATRAPLFTGSGHVALQSIRSARGVQQGDPLGPVLFALAVHPAIAEARAATEISHPVEHRHLLLFLRRRLLRLVLPRPSAAFSPLCTEGFRRIGLTVNLDKTEVIPACSLAQAFCPADFQGCSWNGTSNFKLLGAPVGSDAWCEELLGRRIGKARALLSAIGRRSTDAFSLLRSCSGWSKVLYSCRTVPPDAQMCGLRTADSGLRAALGQLIGRPLSEDDWRLADFGPDVAAGNMLLPLTSPVSLLAVSCAASCGRLSIPLTWTRVAALRRQRRPSAELSPLGLTSMPSATPFPRCPCPGWLRLDRFLVSLGTPPFPDTAVCTSRLAGFRVLGLGSPLTHRASVPTFLPPFSAWLSSVVFVCLCGWFEKEQQTLSLLSQGAGKSPRCLCGSCVGWW